jgi:methylated-DNA-[protein]-cysteine S-methyltransferase
MNTSTTAYQAIIELPLAFHPIYIGVKLEADAISGLDFLWNGIAPIARSSSLSPASQKVLAQLAEELVAYARNSHTAFRVPIQMEGTPFQQKVWQALRKIPAGATLTYGELAQRLGSGARAVANACRRNPISLIVPCHRVVAQDGLGGYGGTTEGELVEFKQSLLEYERKH